MSRTRCSAQERVHARLRRVMAVRRRAGTHAARIVWAGLCAAALHAAARPGRETYFANSRTASTTRSGTSCATQCPAPSKTSVLTRGISDTARRRHLLVDRPRLRGGGDAHRAVDLGEPGERIAAGIADIDLLHRLVDRTQDCEFDLGRAAKPNPAIVERHEAVAHIGPERGLGPIGKRRRCAIALEHGVGTVELGPPAQRALDAGERVFAQASGRAARGSITVGSITNRRAKRPGSSFAASSRSVAPALWPMP